MSEQLSEHFSLSEMTYSDTAVKYKASNLPTDIHKKTLKHTCEYFLEPFRSLMNTQYVGKAYNGKKVKSVSIKITSGYRSTTVNQLLKKEGYKPSETSQHCNGEAADFEVVLVFEDGTRTVLPYTTTYQHIKDFVKNGKLSVDQCICEKQGSALWIHGSYKAGGASVNRKQFMKFNGSSYIADKL
jgi:hypothetical protein